MCKIWPCVSCSTMCVCMVRCARRRAEMCSILCAKASRCRRVATGRTAEVWVWTLLRCRRSPQRQRCERPSAHAESGQLMHLGVTSNLVSSSGFWVSPPWQCLTGPGCGWWSSSCQDSARAPAEHCSPPMGCRTSCTAAQATQRNSS